MKSYNIKLVVKSIKSSLLVLTTLLTFYSCSTNDNIEVVGLQCEYLENPLGIDISTPCLSWQLKTEKNNVSQKAYQIIVSSNVAKLKKNIGDLWDSDTVYSDQSIRVGYNGAELKSRQKVFWKVRVWNEANEVTKWSEIASWEMALLDESDWKAKWIGNGELPNGKLGQKNPTSYFRTEFIVKNKIKNARAYISGIGYYELYINGKKVEDHVLSPNQTNYDYRPDELFTDKRIGNMSTRVLYEIFDISKYLQQGKNVVAVILGNGWLYRTERPEYLPLSYNLPRFIAQLEVDYPNGEKQQIVSDALWKYSKGPIVENSIYYGEVYDARLEQPGWNRKGFDDDKWESSRIVHSPEGKLRVQMSPPDRVTGTIMPVSITNLKKGVYRYDFGTMFSGWVKLKVKGERGNILKLTFFEDNGTNYDQNDTYILKGDGVEEWEPRFTWHAFRYVEVYSPDVSLTIENLEGKIVHTDVSLAGTFECSNKLFNRILKDYKNTQLDNMHSGVPSDCPHRERRGYTGDGQISAKAAIYSLDMKSFYTKWINDIGDAQNKKTGYVPDTAPYQQGGGGVAWGSAYIIIPWYMYLYYGDTAILEKHYEGMKHYVEYLKTITDKDGLIVERQLGEWATPKPTIIPPAYVSSAYYYYDLTLMQNIAAILEKESDVKIFTEVAVKTKNAFNHRYYKPNESSYSIGWQGANIFPLAFGLVPKKDEEAVFQTLVKNVEVTAKGHFDTGIWGTQYVLEVLTKYGRADLAYTVMNRRDFPSFGYNIERGATSLWEYWTGALSHSHPMFGSVTAWFFHSLSGINPDPKNPGFKHTIIKPNIVSELDFVNATYPSVYGEIKSDWEIKNGEFELHVNIPPNTTASIFVPGNSVNDVSNNNSNVDFVGVEKDFLHYEVPSGKYHFISRNIGKFMKTPMLSIPVIYPPDSTLFSPDSVLVNIRQYSKDAEIRYTLDGTEPNDNSELFTQPFALKNSAVIIARTFKKEFEPSFIKTNRIVFIDSLKNGLYYNYYLGNWTKLPNFSKLNPVRSGKVFNISLGEFDNLDIAFGLVLSGEIEIKEKGKYTFYLSSNDGSRLFIDDNIIIDYDGLHQSSFKTKKINLRKGIHKIKLEYFQAGGGRGLELLFESDKIEKQFIPADVLMSK